MGDISPMGASNLGVSKYVYMNNVDQNSKQGLPRGLALMDYYKNVPKCEIPKIIKNYTPSPKNHQSAPGSEIVDLLFLATSPASTLIPHSEPSSTISPHTSAQ